ncbi:unnamed protein product, partial [marine sediment metagenome]
FVDTRWYTDEGRIRGSLVALVTELSDKGTLIERAMMFFAKESGLDLPGYLSCWRKFRKAWPFETVHIEQPIYHPQWRYCGTPDRDIDLFEGKPAVLEIKTGAREDWHALQTAAYAYCCPTFAQRFAVYLSADRDAVLVEHTDSADEPTWLGAIQMFQWKEKHGYAT